MVEYIKVNVKLTNLQLSKLKKAVKNNDGSTLRISIKNFNKDELLHELLLTTRQSTKLRNAINNHLATDVKFSKANFEISEYYKNEPRFNGVYSKNNLLKTIKKGAYVINLDEYENVGTHWIALFVKPKYTVYFDSFGIEHIPKEIKHAIGNKEIKVNIFRIQAYDSIMCGYYCIEFINYMLEGKSLIDFTSLFSPHDFEKNDKIIKRIFKNE